VFQERFSEGANLIVTVQSLVTGHSRVCDQHTSRSIVVGNGAADTTDISRYGDGSKTATDNQRLCRVS
jgi:hypothetical protein